MQTDLQWSLAQAGALTTANSVAYLLGAALTGFAARRWGALPRPSASACCSPAVPWPPPR
ncbi:hypothetical protein [Micromonospora sp. NPDC004551]|uniref:hypothetical protein n=1 Tax=Micromonospora sp. NPDC004551 TaxID=3154284 RepID=UPI0033A5897F